MSPTLSSLIKIILTAKMMTDFKQVSVSGIYSFKKQLLYLLPPTYSCSFVSQVCLSNVFVHVFL